MQNITDYRPARRLGFVYLSQHPVAVKRVNDALVLRTGKPGIEVISK
jgi:hypothetical protein